MIFATAHFRFAEDLDLDLDLGLDFDLDWDFDFGLRFEADADLALTGLPERLRLPSTERPPPSIMAA
jgi:hypothetical protein